MRLTTLLGVILGLAAVAVLYPIFAPAETHHRPLCLTHAKMAGLAQIIYASDFDDRFPAHDRWMDASYPYAKDWDLYRCPQVPLEVGAAASQGPTDPRAGTNHPAATEVRGTAWGYAFNAALDRAKAPENAPKVPLLYDSVNLERNASDRVASLPARPRHERGNTVVYADGHARAVAP